MIEDRIGELHAVARMNFGKIAAAGTSASSAAAANAHGGIAGAGCGARPSAAARIASERYAAERSNAGNSDAGENPISMKIGSVAALWTAQPRTGRGAESRAHAERYGGQCA